MSTIRSKKNSCLRKETSYSCPGYGGISWEAWNSRQPSRSAARPLAYGGSSLSPVVGEVRAVPSYLAQPTTGEPSAELDR